jgi:hypothetical protein
MWLAACLVLPTGAAAQEPPEPEQQLSDPDRPDVTNGTHIVDVGLLQIEFGGIYSRNSQTDRGFGTPVTARMGVTNWLELRVGNDGILTQIDDTGRATGVGNTQIGAKLRLWADPGGVPVLSILPAVNLPTADAEKGLGSGDVDVTLAFLSGTDIAERAHVDVNYGIGAIGAGAGRPHFVQHLISVSGSAAFGPWNPYVEAFWFSRQDVDSGPTVAVDAGAIYTLTPRLAIDGGVQFGATRDAPDFAVFAGVSVVVGNILGEHGVHERQRSAERRRAHAHH